MKKTEQIAISGMHCTACAFVIEKAVKEVKGVEQVVVQYTNEKAVVTYSETKPEAILAAIQKAGYTGEFITGAGSSQMAEKQKTELQDAKKKFLIYAE